MDIPSACSGCRYFDFHLLLVPDHDGRYRGVTGAYHAQAPGDEGRGDSLMDSVVAGSSFLRDQLKKLGTPQAVEFLADDRMLTKMDQVIVGLPNERAAEILRIVMNLGIHPDDHAWQIVAAAGYAARVTEGFSTAGSDLLKRVEDAIEKYDENDTVMTRARKKEFEAQLEQLKDAAARMADASMKAQFSEEDAKLRQRFMISIESVLKDYKNKLLSERSAFTKEQARSMGIMGVVVLAAFTLGGWAGVTLGYDHATASGAVSDAVYRLEQLGAGWSGYRATLSAAAQAEADTYIAHHTVYLPNPRGR